MDQTSIAEGIGGYTMGASSGGAVGWVNTRQAYIQGISGALVLPAGAADVDFHGGEGMGRVPNQQSQTGYAGNGSANFCTRRYQISFALGMFNQDKLVS